MGFTISESSAEYKFPFIFIDLDATLACLGNVLLHYEVSQDLCNLIHLGPSEHDIGVFLEALEKLQRAQQYFLNNNPQSVELENVTSLLNTGCESLNNYFRFNLKRHCAPVKPVDLLDLIYVEEDTSNDDCPSIKQLPTSAREELQLICNWLDQNVRREYVNIYATERADVVFRSLNMLKDHQRSGSWGAEPMVSEQIIHNYLRIRNPTFNILSIYFLMKTRSEELLVDIILKANQGNPRLLASNKCRCQIKL